MKSNITISLDPEIVKKLKAEINYSDLINEQMKGYYNVKLVENKEALDQKLLEIKQILKISRKKKRDIDDMLNKIEKKDRKIKKFLRKKGLSRSKLIDQIKKRRADENKHQYKSTQYFITPETEADRILKGGDEHDRM